MRYFDHDTRASQDDKIVALRLACGGAAIDAYWCIIEKIYAEEKGLCVEQPGVVRALAHNLCVSDEQLKTYINVMVEVGLLCWSADEGGRACVISARSASTIENYHERARKSSLAGKKSGEARRLKAQEALCLPGEITECGVNERSTDDEQTFNERSASVEQEANERLTDVEQTFNEPLTNRIEEKRIEKNKRESVSFDNDTDACCEDQAKAKKEKKPKPFDAEAREILRYLNAVCCKNLRESTDENLRPIRARLSDGYTVEQCKFVIENKTREWGKDEKCRKWLCPSTLFRPGNFDKYLNEKPIGGDSRGFASEYAGAF